MERNLLPTLRENKPSAGGDYENFVRTVRRFTSFQWIDYELKYPELDMPLVVFTVGPDFISRSTRERHYDKAKAVQVTDKLTVALDRISETKEFRIGNLADGGNIEHIFAFEQEKNILQKRYALFVTDHTEWERIKGHPTSEILNDDFTVFSYVVGADVVEVLVFDLLSKTNQVSVNGDNSVSVTIPEDRPSSFTI